MPEMGPNNLFEREVLYQLAAIREDISAMGTTISQQIDAATATLVADDTAMAAALTAIQAELASLVPGSTVSQAQVDALNVAVAGVTAAVAQAQAAANPPAPTPAPGP